MSYSERGPVVPIPPAYKEDGSLDLEQVTQYVKFLWKNGISTVMTTAGTSQFNLLDLNEVRRLNICVLENFKGKSIMGLPPLSEYHLLKEIAWYNKFWMKSIHSMIMILYPDRHYNDTNLINFFRKAAKKSDFGVYVHGMPMRAGRGGTYNFSYGVMAELIETPNIWGIKEETTDLESAYKIFSQVKPDNNFDVIVAGGSMRRFLLLHAAGATRFLSGIGNIYPKIEIEFIRAVNEGDLKLAEHLVRTYEDPFFEQAMRHGWHRSLRSVLTLSKLMKTGNREPFSQLSKIEKGGLKKWLGDINLDHKVKYGEYSNE